MAPHIVRNETGSSRATAAAMRCRTSAAPSAPGQGAKRVRPEPRTIASSRNAGGRGYYRQDSIVPIGSVIIPTYNLGPYLRESIESVLGQDVSDVEVIVVDDVAEPHRIATSLAFLEAHPELDAVFFNGKRMGLPDSPFARVVPGKFKGSRCC